MKLEEGKTYKVLKDGARLTWWVYVGPSTHQGASADLIKGDEIVYRGHKMGLGADNIPTPNFKRGDVSGEFWPNNWGQVEDGWLEAVDES